MPQIDFMLRPKEILESSFTGAAGGFIGLYLIPKTLEKIRLMKFEEGALQALPCIYAGLAGSLIFEAARLTVDISLVVLGDRALLQNGSGLPHYLRKFVWARVDDAKMTLRVIDILYSGTCGIRIEETVKQNQIPEYEMRIMEIVRRAFLEQIHVAATATVPQLLGLKFVESRGFRILIGPSFTFLCCIGFVAGISMKLSQVIQTIQYKEESLGLRYRNLNMYYQDPATQQRWTQAQRQAFYPVLLEAYGFSQRSEFDKLERCLMILELMKAQFNRAQPPALPQNVPAAVANAPAPAAPPPLAARRITENERELHYRYRALLKLYNTPNDTLWTDHNRDNFMDELNTAIDPLLEERYDDAEVILASLEKQLKEKKEEQAVVADQPPPPEN